MNPAGTRTGSARQRRVAGIAATLLMGAMVATALAGCASGAPTRASKASAPAASIDAAVYREAYVYGYPMVDNYRVMYSYFVDRNDPEYKGPWNEVHNIARVFTPQDKAIQTPNSDTPYSFLGADLRREPLVLSVPAVDGDRYYALQFIDLYTHNFAYVGSRATGNAAGRYLLAGPGWEGGVPDGVDSVIRSETELALVLYRTQLLGPDDLAGVQAVQSGFSVMPLSAYAGVDPPPAPPAMQFQRPLMAEAQKSSPEFFGVLNFLLQFAPTHSSEVALRERFAAAGIAPGRPFDASGIPPEQLAVVEQGIADAWVGFAAFKAVEIDTGKHNSADGFGTRQFLGNDYLVRMTSAVLGIYGNSKEEAVYPAYFTDADGVPLNASGNRYTMHFGPGGLPPVNSFWSITMYELPSRLLIDNGIDRYLINSAMVPDLVRDADGGITIHVQKDSPVAERQANWLPAPDGPFFMVLRAYWPKPEMLDGRWKQPPAVRAAD
ncbi:DUF1254 domain-containing protein [Luteimonas sp. A534]